MTILPITAKVSKTAAGTDASIAIATLPVNTWTIFLKIWSFTGGTNNVNRARINIEDSVDAFTTPLAGPVRCIVPVTNIPEGRTTSYRWRDFDDLRFGTTSAVLRTNLTRITGGTIIYEAWLTY